MKLRRTRRPLRRYKTVTLRSKLKHERRRRAGKIVLLAALLGGFVYGGWWSWKTFTGFLFHSDAFKIRSIEVKGGKNVTRSEIVALLPFRPGDNIFTLRVSETEQNIRQCKPELRSISICRAWKKVVVKLQERQPVACLVVDGQRLGVDFENSVFPLRGKLAHDFLPEIRNPGENDRGEILAFVRTFASSARELFPQVERLGLESVNDIVFELKDGPSVYWGPLEKEKLGPKLKRLVQVMDDAKMRFVKVDYINLCYFDDGRILVKPREKQAAASAFLTGKPGDTPAPSGAQGGKKGI